MNDERMQSLLDAWYRDRDEAPREPGDGIARVMGKLPQVRQRGRWWPLPTFARPMSTFPTREPAPAPIPATNGHPPARGFTMFSALKFMVASVIVALFGGFLLAGVHTTQQGEEKAPAAVSASPTIEATSEPTEASSTSVRSDILPGVELTVEEVEPGVFKVLNDGVRDLVLGDFRDILAGHDGSVWLVHDVPGGPDSPITRLGSDRSFQLPQGWDTRIVVGPDGTVWVSRTRQASNKKREVNRIYSLTDGKWTRRLRTEAFGGPHGLAVGPDGTIWTTRPAWGEKEGVVVTHLGPDGWQRLKKRAPSQGDLAVTESGEVWLGLWRYRNDDDGWQQVTVDAVVLPFNSGVEVGADGTVWYAGVEPLMVDGERVGGDDPLAWEAGDSFLMRYDGTEWRRWGPADGVPTLGWETALGQAPDGGLWMATLADTPCPEHWGLAYFDGSGWQYFLSGRCVVDLDVARDGSVWARDGNGLYVITPEAVVATE